MLEQQGAMFLILAGTAIIPFFARRFRLPSAALEIAFGFVLFNFVLHHHPEWFDLLSELGFILLMFIAGMELDLAWLRRSGKALWYTLVALLSFALTPLIFLALGHSFFLGLAVSMISAGIAVPVLRELGLDRTPLGQAIFGVTLTGELLSILMLTLTDTFLKHGATLHALFELGQLVLLFALALLVLKLLYLLAWWHPDRVAKVMESEDPVEEGIRAVVTVAFGGALLAGAAEVEPILGSFVAGTIFSHVFRAKGRFEEKISAVGFGFLIPFFFVGVGAGLDAALLAAPGTVNTALFLSAMVLVSNLTPLPLAGRLGLSLGEASGLALLLSAPLSMIVVAGTLGERMGLLDAETHGALILTGLVASLLYPSLFRLLISRLSGSGAPQPEKG